MEEKERVEKNVIMKERERKTEKHRPFFFFFLMNGCVLVLNSIVLIAHRILESYGLPSYNNMLIYSNIPSQI